MKDPSGRELPKTYEYSVVARCYEMVQMINEASEMINNVINSIVGG